MQLLPPPKKLFLPHLSGMQFKKAAESNFGVQEATANSISCLSF